LIHVRYISLIRIDKTQEFNIFKILQYYYSKSVPWFSPMYKKGNELCIMYPLIYGSVV